jgi:hypothetical protein
MTIASMIELAVAVAIFAAGIWLYRARRSADEGYGSQGAVILFVIGIIVGAHALGAFDYHPSAGERDQLTGGQQ